jgi:hypothetical protein
VGIRQQGGGVSDETFKKWWPHLRTKVQKIVAVTFEDGTTIQVDDAELELGGYLKTIEKRREDAFVRKMTGFSADDFRALIRAQNSVLASERASKPRKPVTKPALIAFKEKYEGDHGKTRGWKTAACLEFRIDLKTLNKRMAE